MKKIKGNIWQLSTAEDDIVIPTSIGWRTNGESVMGRGLAKDASRYYPQLPKWYGEKCSEHGESTPVLRYGPLLLFPVKPLDDFQPYLSWKKSPSLDLVLRSLEQLAEIPIKDRGCVFVPMVGCGREGLDPEDVLPIIEAILGDNDQFILLEGNGLC